MNWQDSQESIMQIAACKCQFIARKLLKSNKLLPPWSYEFYDLHIMLWIVWNSIWHVWFCVTVDCSRKRKYLNQFLGNIYFINWLTVCILHFKLLLQKASQVTIWLYSDGHVVRDVNSSRDLVWRRQKGVCASVDCISRMLCFQMYNVSHSE